MKNRIPIEAAEKIFDEMTDFAKYAFNKSHAACYAVVGYQTAWLKAHYPVEFMAALMTSVMDNAAKVSGYIEECKKMGIQLRPRYQRRISAVFRIRWEDSLCVGGNQEYRQGCGGCTGCGARKTVNSPL